MKNKENMNEKFVKNIISKILKIDKKKISIKLRIDDVIEWD